MTTATHQALSRPAAWVKARLLGWFERGGWGVEGALPLPTKAVVMAGPHTSNYDFLIFLGAMEKLGVNSRYVGKASLFRWPPMGRFMRAVGGIAVDRTVKNDLVAQATAEFGKAASMLLVIAPEGTRDPTTQWRMGFYRIALAAGVPIVCGGPDYIRKVAIFSPPIFPTGNMEDDLKPAWDFFRTLVPRFPDKVLFPDGTGMDGRPRQA